MSSLPFLWPLGLHYKIVSVLFLSTDRHCPASRGIRGGGERLGCREMFTGLFWASAIFLTAPSFHLCFSPAKRWQPCNLLHQGQKMFVYLFSVPLPPSVNVIALVWTHTFHLKKTVSFWNIFFNLYPSHCCLFEDKQNHHVRVCTCSYI